MLRHLERTHIRMSADVPSVAFPDDDWQMAA
jgi:hypothetical protein